MASQIAANHLILGIQPTHITRELDASRDMVRHAQLACSQSCLLLSIGLFCRELLHEARCVFAQKQPYRLPSGAAFKQQPTDT